MKYKINIIKNNSLEIYGNIWKYLEIFGNIFIIRNNIFYCIFYYY